MSDLLISNADQIVTCDPHLFESEDEGGRSIGLIDHGDILISEGTIRAVGDVRGPDSPDGGTSTLSSRTGTTQTWMTALTSGENSSVTSYLSS